LGRHANKLDLVDVGLQRLPDLKTNFWRNIPPPSSALKWKQYSI
jgi:hypothetical protein